MKKLVKGLLEVLTVDNRINHKAIALAALDVMTQTHKGSIETADLIEIFNYLEQELTEGLLKRQASITEENNAINNFFKIRDNETNNTITTGNVYTRL